MKEALLKARQQRFGTSNEKQSPDQIALFNEAEADLVGSNGIEETGNTTTVQSRSRKKHQRTTIPDDIERESITYDLPAKLKAIRRIRKKYACPCCEQYVMTAKKPKQPIEKSLASPGLLA